MLLGAVALAIGAQQDTSEKDQHCASALVPQEDAVSSGLQKCACRARRELQRRQHRNRDIRRSASARLRLQELGARRCRAAARNLASLAKCSTESSQRALLLAREQFAPKPQHANAEPRQVPCDGTKLHGGKLPNDSRTGMLSYAERKEVDPFAADLTPPPPPPTPPPPNAHGQLRLSHTAICRAQRDGHDQRLD